MTLDFRLHPPFCDRLLQRDWLCELCRAQCGSVCCKCVERAPGGGETPACDSAGDENHACVLGMQSLRTGYCSPTFVGLKDRPLEKAQ